jgi:hypothetical protein
LRWAGLGLISYAFEIALDLLASLAAGTTAEQLFHGHRIMLQPVTFLTGCGPGIYAREKNSSNKPLFLHGSCLSFS